MKYVLMIACCSVFALAAVAQPPGNRGPDGGQRPGPPPGFGPPAGRGGPGEFGNAGRMPQHPIMEALDADNNGELSPDEIAGATEALKQLDNDGDGMLSRQELRPNFRRQGRRGEGGRSRSGRPQRPGGEGAVEDGAGRRARRGRSGPPEGGPPGEGRRRGQFDAGAFADRILSFDKNADDQITREELPERMRAMVEKGDSSGDDALDREEIEAMARRSD